MSFDITNKLSKLAACTERNIKPNSNGDKCESPKYKFEWLYEKMSRSDAESLIGKSKMGTFLIRPSEHYPGDYTLTINGKEGIEHYRIISRDGKFTIDNETNFTNLLELVEHYSKDEDGLCCQLLIPAGDSDTKQPNSDVFFDKTANFFIDPKAINLIDVIGEGEYARVYKAQFNGSWIAVKILKSHLYMASFTREAVITRTLNNQYLIRSYGVSTIDNGRLPYPDQIAAIAIRSPCILLEYMPGGNLHEYLMSRGRAVISTEDLLRFLLNICEGMTYLESISIAHCDIAANNVLLTSDLTAKLSDFGLAARFDQVTPNVPGHREKLRIKWAAPESLEHDIHTNKSDVWSFAVLVWELFQFGRTPYPRVRNSQMLSYLKRGNRMQFPDNCPLELQSLMKNCWLPDPNMRPTFVDILRNLRRFQCKK
ncbi:hypothetical protein ACOME3_009813 [Neoechinorhynchus agilis]